MILNLTEKNASWSLKPTNQPTIHPTNQQNIQKANFKEAGKNQLTNERCMQTTNSTVHSLDRVMLLMVMLTRIFNQQMGAKR